VVHILSWSARTPNGSPVALALILSNQATRFRLLARTNGDNREGVRASDRLLEAQLVSIREIERVTGLDLRPRRETLMSTLKRKPQRPQPVPCQPLSRVRYVTGQVLSVDDFIAEQNYFREKLRRHNRTLHQPGIVDGLEVTLESPGVRVAPGLALDAAGNEVCVPVAQGASLPSMVGEVYVVLRYTEIEAHPIPVLGPPGQGNAASVPSRIQESFEIGFDRPGANPTPALSQDASPPIRLAHLRPVRGRWRVDARFRRPEAK
jgi:hypothetical protein